VLHAVLLANLATFLARAMQKLTSVLIVEAIEPCLEFWCERLGFTKTVEVPEGERLGFVILEHGPLELMLQSRASVAADNSAIARDAFRSALFVEVDDLARMRRAVDGLPLVFDERTTFYGAREICVRDPAGNVVVFAQFARG
jgi:catechol 2,3-dioxygenase-like lactoylglutathione lyase family enzyme